MASASDTRFLATRIRFARPASATVRFKTDARKAFAIELEIWLTLICRVALFMTTTDKIIKGHPGLACHTWYAYK